MATSRTDGQETKKGASRVRGLRQVILLAFLSDHNTPQTDAQAKTHETSMLQHRKQVQLQHETKRRASRGV